MRTFLNRSHGRSQFVGDMGEKLPLHVIQLLKFCTHPIDCVNEVSQLAGGSNVQRRTEITLSDLLDMILQLTKGAQNRVTGKAGEGNAKYEREQDQLLRDRFGLRGAFP